MPYGDAASMWETEAMHASRRVGAPADQPTAPPGLAHTWATLREAHYQTGIPIETLRKWAKKGAVPSYLDNTTAGIRRVVRLDAVRRRAAELGRPIAPVELPAPPLEPIRPAISNTAPAAQIPTNKETPTPAARTGTDVDEQVGAVLPPDTMIVPVGAWEKMLMQLGNLHEAGQQLAEARERAAKAETEATFLRERVSELRRDLGERHEAAEPDHILDTEPNRKTEPTVAEPPATAAPAEKLWRYIYRGWRARRR